MPITPTNITLHASSRVLEIEYEDGQRFRLPFEVLRVYSPSAEVRGHGPGQETLQVGKRDVTITALQPVGYYAVQPEFSDGHSSGIYSWEYLHELGVNLGPTGAIEVDASYESSVPGLLAVGDCSNHGECQAVCPKGISMDAIASMRREYVRATVGL